MADLHDDVEDALERARLRAEKLDADMRAERRESTTKVRVNIGLLEFDLTLAQARTLLFNLECELRDIDRAADEAEA